ncbi:MAG: sulfatase [Phycisphaeraceae bacterium]
MRILYLDLDALTPSHLSCYGYHRQTSPTIDRLAAEGLRCTNTYCSDAPCLPSRTAFYSGRLGIQTGVVGHGGTAAQPKIEGPTRGFNDMFQQQGLAGRLQKAGLHTAMISPFGQRHAAWQFYAGFHEIHNTGKGGMDAAEEVTPTVIDWLDRHAADDNWYLHVNYWDIHTPYRAPADYGEPFANDPLPDWLDDDTLARHQKKTGPHSALDIGMWHGNESPNHPRHPGSLTDRTQLRRMIDGYDTAIRYVDDQIHLIINRLKAMGVYDDTAIVISADHGENQGELGIYGEHATADQGTCNIPFILRYPGGVKGHVDHGLHYHLDWAPTLLDLMGLEPSPIWDGQSFADTVRSGQDAGRDDLVISQCCHVCQRSLRFDRWLYIRTYHCGMHLFPKEMLFDLDADPHEQHDVAAAHPDVCREAAARYLAWHDQQMAKMPQDKVDPMWTVIREGGPFHANADTGSLHHSGGFEKYLDRLEQTGRADGAAQLRDRYPELLETTP